MDSSLVKANVSSHGLAPSGMTVEEFREQAIQVNGLFLIPETTVDDDGVENEETRYFQNPEGKLPLNPVDTDARWRTLRSGKASGLQCQENVIVDLGGFILSRGVTHASERESKAVPDLLDRLPLALVFPVMARRDGFHYLRGPAPAFLRSLPDIAGRKLLPGLA